MIIEVKLSGYKIKCPNCGVEYNIDININLNKIKCLDCFFEYLQTENIIDVISHNI